jgi:cupin superfamily acireductone dioxygenase involved in methionine salvage
MHIQTVSYTRTFNLGNYSSEKIGVEFSLNEGESANKALDHARELVEEYHSENLKRLKKNYEFLGLDEVLAEEIIPTQSKQTLAEKTKAFIDSCKTKEELKAWELMSKNNPELLQHYNNKLKTL